MGASLRIGIFGGSFNPPHNGHVGICHYLIAQGLIDRLLIIPCWKHPYDKPLAPYVDRLAMCQAAFGGIGGVEVSELERELGGVSHTIRTVQRLRALHPTAALCVIVGEDLAAEMALWKDVDAIRAAAEFLTIPRGPRSPVPDISATDIRERVAAGQSIDTLVPPTVAGYIVGHRLYCSPSVGY